MKDWKDQLRDIKHTLRKADTPEKRGDKPEKVDFEPPNSWLTSASVEVDRPSSPARRESILRPAEPCASIGSAHPIPAPSNVITRHLVALDDPKPERQPVAPTSATPPPIFRPWIDASRSLSMPNWAKVGMALQHPEAHGGVDMTVRLGVDFGTAFTKVAIRAGFDLIVVDWIEVTGDASPASFVVPGFVCRGSGGEFGWRRIEGGEWQGNLKLPLIDSRSDFDCPVATLAYLAEVICYARAFLYRHPEIGRKLANRTLRWELNLGCPTAPHEKSEIVERFRRVARTAWWLAGRDDLEETAIRAAWDRRDIDTGLETEPGIVPEFVAQIASYLSSPQVNEGLHALVDVGAATLDVATFNVVLPREEETPRIPIFFSAVKPLGTHFLSHRRHQSLGLELVWDDATPIEAADEFARRHSKDAAVIDGIDAEFVREVARCIAGVIDVTRTSARGDPRSSAWREGLPVFVTGGGAACDVYRRALRESEAAEKAHLEQAMRFRFIEMDLARATLVSIDAAALPRLTVAIGLTEDAENIARIVPHRDIKPITSIGSVPRQDRDELYPK